MPISRWCPPSSAWGEQLPQSLPDLLQLFRFEVIANVEKKLFEFNLALEELDSDIQRRQLDAAIVEEPGYPGHLEEIYAATLTALQLARSFTVNQASKPVSRQSI